MEDLDKELEELLAEEEEAQRGGAGAENQPGEGDTIKNLPLGLKKTLVNLREKRRTAEAETAKVKAELEAERQKHAKPSALVPIEARDMEEIVDLRVSGYSKEEIEFVKRNRQPGQSLTEVANDPYVVAAIEAQRAKAKLAAATPKPSQRGGESVPPVKRPKDWTPAERRAHQEQIIERNRKFRGGNQ